MKNTILGAIAGDIIGSVFEWNNYKGKDFELFTERSHFTDDTVMTVAVADALMNEKDMATTLSNYGRKYPGRGYGGMFAKWLKTADPQPYNSFGNGSAMRASAAGFMANSLEEALQMAKKSAEVTHDHPKGIRGAEATAAAVFMAKNGSQKLEIKQEISDRFGYNLDFTLDDIRESYTFDVTCPGTLPPAIVAFLESEDYEDAIRNAVSIGGDSDTIACITGGIAAAYYREISEEIREKSLSKLSDELREFVLEFEEKY